MNLSATDGLPAPVPLLYVGYAGIGAPAAEVIISGEKLEPDPSTGQTIFFTSTSRAGYAAIDKEILKDRIIYQEVAFNIFRTVAKCL